MKVRIIGPKDEVAELISSLREKYEISKADGPKASSEVDGWELWYLEMPSAIQKIVGNLQEWQILQYCSDWRSKANVMHFFDISWGAAEEILERMYASGSLIRDVEDSGSRRSGKYVYRDAVAGCGDCESCKYWARKRGTKDWQCAWGIRKNPEPCKFYARKDGDKGEELDG